MLEIKEWSINPKYLIYSDGRVYSKISNKFLKPNIDKYGYYKIVLYHIIVGVIFLHIFAV